MSTRQIGSCVGIAALTIGVVAGAPGPWASADGCPDVEVIFARGTGEPPGVGSVGQAFVSSLSSLLGGKSVGVYAVNYPATLNVLHAAAGANDAIGQMNYLATNCPNTRMVLGGFSQGAYVIDLVTGAPMPSLGFNGPPTTDIANNVAAVAVFGNPS